MRREGFLTRYVDRLLTDYNRDGRDLTVVWDCGNATAGAVVPTLVKGLTGRHILLNERIDGNFPAHAPDSSKPENLRELSETVLREHAGVVDSRGKMVGVDNLLPIFAEEILKSHPNAVFIADVKSGKSFSSEIERLGGRPLIWKTGHSFSRIEINAVARQRRLYFFNDCEFFGVRTRNADFGRGECFGNLVIWSAVANPIRKRSWKT